MKLLDIFFFTVYVFLIRIFKYLVSLDFQPAKVWMFLTLRINTWTDFNNYYSNRFVYLIVIKWYFTWHSSPTFVVAFSQYRLSWSPYWVFIITYIKKSIDVRIIIWRLLLAIRFKSPLPKVKKNRLTLEKFQLQVK